MKQFQTDRNKWDKLVDEAKEKSKSFAALHERFLLERDRKVKSSKKRRKSV